MNQGYVYQCVYMCMWQMRVYRGVCSGVCVCMRSTYIGMCEGVCV